MRNRDVVRRALQGLTDSVAAGKVDASIVVTALLLHKLAKAEPVESLDHGWCPVAVRDRLGGDAAVHAVIEGLVRDNVCTRPASLELVAWWRRSLRSAYVAYGPDTDLVLRHSIRAAFKRLDLLPHMPAYGAPHDLAVRAAAAAAVLGPSA